MKFYISWYPTPPDPKYWEWFKVDGLMLSLAHFKARLLTEALKKDLHNFVGFKGEIFLDSGAFDYGLDVPPRTQLETLELQRWLGADIVSHLDKPFINLAHISDDERMNALKSTIENAKIARKWQKKTGLQVVYVIQGWGLKSTDYCAKKMAKLKADYYGIGSLYKTSPKETIERVKIVRMRIGIDPKLHLFGVSRFDVLKPLSGYVDSFDSSSPVRAAVAKEVVNPSNKKRAYISGAIPVNCCCPVCKQRPLALLMIGMPQSKRYHNELRALHNAYWLTQFAKFDTEK